MRPLCSAQGCNWRSKGSQPQRLSLAVRSPELHRTRRVRALLRDATRLVCTVWEQLWRLVQARLPWAAGLPGAPEGYRMRTTHAVTRAKRARAARACTV